jgi:hypothetical protein
MLSFAPRLLSDCQGVRRRDVLRIGSLAALGLSLPDALRLRAASAAEGSPATAGSDTNCIFIWTQGGTSHHDTFDPKPEAPDAVRGSYATIGTAVPGVQFTEVCPRMAAELGRYSLLRSWNPQNGSHGTADQWVMSGRQFNPALTYPTYGSVVSYYHGFRGVLPPFVQLGPHIDRRFGGGSSGFLGQEYSAFELLADPNQPGFAVRDVTPPGGIGADRIDDRRALLTQVDALQRRADEQPALFDAQDEHYRAALNMITAPETKRAFCIEDEDPRIRDRYGRTKFGQSALLARRLIEAGVRYVTLTDGGWDTHANNFDGLKRLMPPIDQGLPELLTDLAERGLLESTLVVWGTDFGRTPKINSASGRDHWSTAGFIVAAGAGVPGGLVLGATDGEGGAPTRDEYHSQDLAATLYAKLGIPHDLMATTPDGRPIRLNEGRVIREWM